METETSQKSGERANDLITIWPVRKACTGDETYKLFSVKYPPKKNA